jgi:ABC-2 type transport system ATP-binding protein
VRLRVKDDEPTIGFDVVAKECIRRIIEYIYQTRGIIVLLTTHVLSDVERLCKWVMIIDHGK